jgi:outer membrane receptor protein involved in Fe transport
MNRKDTRVRSCFAQPSRAALAALLSLPLATVVNAQAVDQKPGSDEETVHLSPFVVDATQDQGYRATNTLAGSRINTSLRDVAAPITVVTKEFMTDTAAVDVNDVLAYTANTEGTRDFTSSVSSLGRPSDEIAANPNGANRVRGLASADITRDYFYTISTSVGFDTYNLDSVTINRGPNSVLAGLGSPAGIINYAPQLAGLSKTHTAVSFRFGSFNDLRATLNTNLVAKRDVLAFRVAGVWNEKGFKQKPSYNHDNRLYLATTYQPWKKTTVRGSYEAVRIRSNNPNTITPEDDVSQWVAIGSPMYDSKSTGPVPAGISRDGGNAPIAVFNANGQLERSYPQTTTYNFFQNIRSGFTPLRMNSNKYLQLDRVNLQPSKQDPLEYRSANISVDQEIVPDLNANVAYVHEKVDNNFLNLFRTEYANYMVDVNKYLPDGTVNPHAGETYMQFRGLDNKQVDHNTNDIIRGTLTYDLNLTKYNKWFGRYRLTGFGESRETESEHWQYNARVTGLSDVESLAYRFYLGGTGTTPATTVPRQPGLITVPNNMVLDRTTNTYSTSALTSYYGLKSDQRQLVKLNTSAFVAQAYLLDDRVVGLFGIRRDKNEAKFASAAGGNGGNVNPAGAYGPASSVAAQTKTYGVVVHPLKWLSLHYNHSENFIPNAGSVDLLGTPTASPTGVAKDYGVSFNTLDDKLNVKLNWFELTAAGASAGNANFPLAQWTVPYMERTFMPDLARQAGITYKPLMAPDLIVGDPRLANAYTSDNVSKGLELELTYNVTRNWRVMGQVSKQEAKQSNIAAGLTSFIENRLAYWKSIPALWNGFTAQNVGWGVGRTGEQQWNGDNNPFYIGYKSVEGKPSPQLAKWHASGLTNYFVSEGPLKGVNIGGGFRYIDKAIIGNPNIYDANGVAIALDLAHPYTVPSRISVDAWIGYKMKVFANRYDLSFQLNVRDLEQNGGFRPVGANPDGGHAVYRIVQPRTYYLTTTLEF